MSFFLCITRNNAATADAIVAIESNSAMERVGSPVGLVPVTVGAGVTGVDVGLGESVGAGVVGWVDAVGVEVSGVFPVT
jgi:hypothetical protein